MEQLLSIRTIPFQYEMRVINAKLEMDQTQPEVDVTRQTGGLKMHHTPAKIHIDSTKARESMGLMSIGRAVQKTGDKGMQAALDASAQITKEGNIMMDTRNKNAIPQIAFQHTTDSIDTIMAFIPSTPAEVSFSPHQLSMKYEMDKLTFDWRTNNKPKMNFVPASIEFKVKDYARLEIEYLGGPIYVPKSSDPNYDPLLPLNVLA